MSKFRYNIAEDGDASTVFSLYGFVHQVLIVLREHMCSAKIRIAIF